MAFGMRTWEKEKNGVHMVDAHYLMAKNCIISLKMPTEHFKRPSQNFSNVFDLKTI